MKRSVVARLRDILAMIDAAAEIVDELAFADYRANSVARLAVERCIEVVSEASRHVPLDEKARFPTIPWVELAAIGNKLRHEHNRIDDLILWRVVTVSSPELRPVIVAILHADPST